MFEKPHLPLALSAEEIVLLTDRIPNSDVAQGLEYKDAYVPLARRTLLLLGSAYIEMVQPTGYAAGEVTIQVDEEIAWTLRAKVNTADIDSKGGNLGIGLSRKLYGLLLQFNAGLDLPAISMEEMADVAAIRQRLEAWKSGNGSTYASGSDYGAWTSPPDGAGPSAGEALRAGEVVSRPEDATSADDRAQPAVAHEHDWCHVDDGAMGMRTVCFLCGHDKYGGGE